MTSPDNNSSRLNNAQSIEIVEHLAGLMFSGLELAPGLRAAAKEVSDQRLAGGMQAMAARIEAGDPLGEALGAVQFPEHLRCMIDAGVASGGLPAMLRDYVAQRRQLQNLWHEIRIVMAYPVLLLILTLTVFLFIEAYLISDVVAFLETYDTNALFSWKNLGDSNLPGATIFMIWFSRYGIRILLYGGMFLLVTCLIARLVMGRERTRRLWWNVPLIGKLWLWSDSIEFCRLLRILIEQKVPLVESLSVIAVASRDPCFAKIGRESADVVAAGGVLSDFIDSQREIPRILGPHLKWGEDRNELAEALSITADMLERWVRLRIDLLRVILPPVTFIFVAFVVLQCVVGIIAPVFQFIQQLATF